MNKNSNNVSILNKDDSVSIIMPSYNTGKNITKTIQSILHQTYSNWELIIIDDYSTDYTDEIIKPFLQDSRIKYIKNEKNSGAAFSRNKGLRVGKGKWIAFLDSDDLWYPNKLEKQLSFMKNHGYKFSFTDYKINNTNGELSPYIYTAPMIITKTMMWRYCYIFTSTVIYDSEYIGLIQIADLKKNNDYAMWLQVIDKTDCYRYPKCLSIYCKRSGSISSGSKFKLIKHHYIMFRKACSLHPMLAGFCMVRNLAWGIHKKLYYRKKAY